MAGVILRLEDTTMPIINATIAIPIIIGTTMLLLRNFIVIIFPPNKSDVFLDYTESKILIS
jgi:hypothetical protein